jgi:hypothetical protein
MIIDQFTFVERFLAAIAHEHLETRSNSCFAAPDNFRAVNHLREDMLPGALW